MHGRDSSYYCLKWAADNMSVTFLAVQTQRRLHINETAFHGQRHLSNLHPRLFLLCPPCRWEERTWLRLVSIGTSSYKNHKVSILILSPAGKCAPPPLNIGLKKSYPNSSWKLVHMHGSLYSACYILRRYSMLRNLCFISSCLEFYHTVFLYMP